jgi:hypothetical protein
MQELRVKILFNKFLTLRFYKYNKFCYRKLIIVLEFQLIHLMQNYLYLFHYN